MRNLLIIIITAALLGISGVIVWSAYKAGSEISFDDVMLKEGVEVKVDPDNGEFLYEVVDGEILVKDILINRILVGTNVSVTYRNTSEETKYPLYKLQFYNTYGLLLGQVEIKENVMLEPGQVGAENVKFTPYPLEQVLAQSHVKAGDALQAIKWIVLSETNSKD
jgi:hypothetical protein